MKRLLFFLLFLSPVYCRAGHAAGLDIYYTHITGNTYRISLTIYGNCNDQPNNNYSSFFTGHPQIAIIDSVAKTTWKTISLDLVPDSTRDVSPYCRSYLDSTNCKSPLFTYQGYTRFIYSDTVTLPAQSARWIFRFTSAMQSGCSGRLGRPAMNNLVNGNGTNAVLEAMLNNATGSNNSSPLFSSSVFTAYCVNVPSSYYQLARDPDNDSLSYQLVAPLREVNGCTGAQALAFTAGYNPLSTTAGGFSFNALTGTMIFTPGTVQTSAVATRISEYKNGVLVGYVMREKIFKVLGTCNNQPPQGMVDSLGLQGAVWQGNNTIIACPGSRIRFSIPIKDNNGDTVTANILDIPPGSSVTINNGRSVSPTIDFSWDTRGVPHGTYTLLGAYQDNGCPLKSEGLVTYTIIINDAGKLGATQVSPTQCIHQAAVQYEVQSTYYPYTLNILKDTTVVRTLTGTSAAILSDSLAAGTYTLELSNVGVPCTARVSLVVADSGVYPFTPQAVSPITYCRNADAVALIATPDSTSLPGTELRWYDSRPDFIGNQPPVPSTRDSGTFIYYVSGQYGECESPVDTVAVTIEAKECNYDITVHNAITPNGDGKNDLWIIDNLGYYPNINVQVFSKLGDRVYEQTAYRNDWDGGNLPSGVYYYLIRLNGPNRTSGTETYKGYLLIKR